ncbi:pirin family protein [Rhizobium rhizogenes]|uniref:pirin family protein n=1 Tax=Rhizobium rhizogenes TaxID=359 RepID=UPI000DDE14A8|nr:pirin family protein [Rhizobium rhizogenes]NTG11805.1 pimeloyl-CoA dehydrogenase [Rhizobium rhizogenes]NTH23316.1 pimeloyl-CoA dehydrogenase [Rhizobium rhizogenes]NTH34161.1 pimeloyl-CoA dehydrogenase [Rhizobium rhizogenes]NTI06417.1 pimeloyl-CoA dehydrogenase [Rhizobium rhizogenes]NTI13228.1 pimeloyl-CoA dehydrogenase [Rhizobium rhizogenes]
MTVTKIPASRMRGNISQGFGVEILYPGLSLTADDSGIGPIGRIDRAQVQPGHLIGMHPHKDDEILTYIRGGEMLHRDTVGNEEKLDKTRFMMMNAGHTFQHEELMLGNSPVRALQIFLRPNAPDLEPMVQFHDFVNESSNSDWRLIAGPQEAPLTVRSDVWVFDARITKGNQLSLPSAAGFRTGLLLYVFDGAIDFGDITITTGESAFTRSFDHQLTGRAYSDVVLFAFDLEARVFRGGMFSGNQKRIG